MTKYEIQQPPIDEAAIDQKKTGIAYTPVRSPIRIMVR
jgi:hypothetical protein